MTMTKRLQLCKNPLDVLDKLTKRKYKLSIKQIEHEAEMRDFDRAEIIRKEP